VAIAQRLLVLWSSRSKLQARAESGSASPPPVEPTNLASALSLVPVWPGAPCVCWPTCRCCQVGTPPGGAVGLNFGGTLGRCRRRLDSGDPKPSAGASEGSCWWWRLATYRLGEVVPGFVGFEVGSSPERLTWDAPRTAKSKEEDPGCKTPTRRPRPTRLLITTACGWCPRPRSGWRSGWPAAWTGTWPGSPSTCARGCWPPRSRSGWRSWPS
jgi:hypothetical protein